MWRREQPRAKLRQPLARRVRQRVGRSSRRGPSASPAPVASASSALNIEALGRHLQRAVRGAWPLLPRPIPVQLDAVAVRIAQVERFADAVIGSAVEGHVRVDQAPQRVGERARSG